MWHLSSLQPQISGLIQSSHLRLLDSWDYMHEPPQWLWGLIFTIQRLFYFSPIIGLLLGLLDILRTFTLSQNTSLDYLKNIFSPNSCSFCLIYGCFSSLTIIIHYSSMVKFIIFPLSTSVLFKKSFSTLKIRKKNSPIYSSSSSAVLYISFWSNQNLFWWRR